MTRKQKLELTWVGKDERPRLEPRILLEDPSLSYHAGKRVTDYDRFDNILIQGDNLLALKALEQEFAGKVKCIFIDPPYNTGSAFEHYDDGIEHSLWLSMMRDRLEMLRALLALDGSIWITIDEREVHYLKLLCDEVFGRSCFRTMITWQRKYSVSNNARGIATICDYVLVYAKSDEFRNNLLPRTVEASSRYSNPDNDPRGPWKAVDYLNQASPAQRPNLCYDIRNPHTGAVVGNPRKAWKYDRETHGRHIEEDRLWWGRTGRNSVPALKLFLAEVRGGMTPHNWWRHEDAGHTDEAKKEMIALFGAKNVFDTPKPERLVERALSIASSKGDLVLDSFLGSGTTAAVAHKMNRRWIGIEMGDHAVTHCQPRLRKVIDGEDPGGITESAGWRGGGGFRFYRLAPSLMRQDAWGNWVINKQYNAEMLAEAVCKLEGFRYSPNGEVFWQQGHSTERDFIYVTTQPLNTTQLEWLSDQVGPERSLLTLASAFLASGSVWPNLTLKKLPNAVLGRCEFGKDDYSLQVAALPEPDTTAIAAAEAAAEAGAAAHPLRATARRGRKRSADPAQESLLDAESDE